jgi:DUF1707 SHOCT-like domain
MTDDLRASDAEREHAVARLRDASAEGRLTLDELAVRTGTAYAARTHGELVAVTADLPERQAAAPAPARSKGVSLVVGLFAPVSRGKRLRLRGKTVVLSLFAPATLDLRQATFESDEPTIAVVGLFAPVRILVPAHVDVDVSVVGVFAPVSESGDAGALSPGAPHVRITGISLFAPTVVRLG